RDFLCPGFLWLRGLNNYEVVSREDFITFPQGEIGLPWRYSIVSDNNLGTLNISAEVTPVPIPVAIWLFGSSILGFVFLQKRDYQFT
ncbi:MAG: hypothetical protein WCP96_15335, partial [Methylococcaceae bacterium]